MNLHRDLKACHEEGGTFPMIRHPLVYAVPFFDSQSEILRLNRALKEKQKICQECLAGHNWAQYIWMHERPYRINAFLIIRENLSNKEYWSLLRDIWIDSENIYSNALEWWEMLSSPRTFRRRFTECEDRKRLKKMPDVLTIYRGTTEIERDGSYLGYSWTLDKKKAEWFAKRLLKPEDGDPCVASATVKKEDVIGFLSGRGEQELVVQNKDLRVIAWENV